MKFELSNGPHLKDNDHTSKMMMRLLIALLPIVIFAIYKNGFLPYSEGYTDLFGAFRPLILIALSVFTSVFTEVIFFLLIRTEKTSVIKYLKESYGIIPGLFLALVLPLNTPFWLIILGAFVATFIGKLLFGGFGYNIFNPALVGVIFVMASYSAVIAANGGYLNPLEIDTIAGATPLSNLSGLGHIGNWTSVVKPYGTLWNSFFGFIPGSLGETSKILIIMGFIYLSLTKVIKWIIPVSYVTVVFIMTYIIGYNNDLGIWYALFNILNGGLLFGAVFMATDPVTSPTTKVGQLLFGLGLGLLTVIFRFLTPYPEGVLTSILTMNMLVIIIDKIGARARFNKLYKYISILIMIAIIAVLSLYISSLVVKPPVKNNNDIKVIDKGKVTTYEITEQGYKSLLKAQITIDNGTITKINILSQNETFWLQMTNANYIDQLIANQKNMDNVDAYSGATVTSNALKRMIQKTLDSYEAQK